MQRCCWCLYVCMSYSYFMFYRVIHSCCWYWVILICCGGRVGLRAVVFGVVLDVFLGLCCDVFCVVLDVFVLWCVLCGLGCVCVVMCFVLCWECLVCVCCVTPPSGHSGLWCAGIASPTNLITLNRNPKNSNNPKEPSLSGVVCLGIAVHLPTPLPSLRPPHSSQPQPIRLCTPLLLLILFFVLFLFVCFCFCVCVALWHSGLQHTVLLIVVSSWWS